MSNIFILNYHLVLPKGNFDVTCRTLDTQLRLLKTFFNVVSLEEICNLKSRGVSPKRTTVAVTFDDGYLDTFVYAIPLCKKHGIPATVFPTASRIVNDDIVRFTLEDYWAGKVAFRDLYKTVPMSVSNTEYLTSGYSSHFMSKGELRKVVEVVDVGSHASIHAQVFHSDTIIDFFDGSNDNWSLIYSYGEEPIQGFPIFPNRNNISVMQGYLRLDVKEYIRSVKGDFFKQQNWKALLKADLTNKFHTSLLTFETEGERLKRVENEILSAKLQVESIINKKVRYFAYPYGHYDPVSTQVVSQYFDAAFTTDLDIVRIENNIYLLPRTKVHKDIFTFINKMIKYGHRK